MATCQSIAELLESSRVDIGEVVESRLYPFEHEPSAIEHLEIVFERGCWLLSANLDEDVLDVSVEPRAFAVAPLPQESGVPATSRVVYLWLMVDVYGLLDGVQLQFKRRGEQVEPRLQVLCMGGRLELCLLPEAACP